MKQWSQHVNGLKNNHVIIDKGEGSSAEVFI